MCGIVGFVGDYQPDLIDRMNAVQAHRGPDGQGIWESPEAEVALGHTRLAILDLSDAGRQPMQSADGRFVLTYNGEIYNYAELRKDLEGRGHVFRSTGDTEVLLAGLVHHGEAFIRRLNGMFAFALWDRAERSLLLARDQLGIKPLYYATPAPGTLLFASELKALCCHPGVSRDPDFAALEQHLTMLHSSGNRTLLKDVKRVPPGTVVRWSTDRRIPQFEPYWEPTFAAEEPAVTNRRDAADRLRELIHESVQRQLVADVPVGAFLSGGLDSSLIVCSAARAGRRLECFTVTFDDRQNRVDQMPSDIPHARRLAEEFGCPLHEIPVTSQAASRWPELVAQMDEPIADPAAITSLLICQLARQQGVPVLLSGQGADELLGGYPRYKALEYSRRLQWIPHRLRALIADSAESLPSALSGPAGALLRRVRRGLVGLDQDQCSQFLNLCASTPSGAVRSILSPEAQANSADNTLWECREFIDRLASSGTSRFLHRDLSVYLPNHNLHYTDRTGMAVGLEARVPLLDMDLVEFATRLPTQWKVRGGNLKAILRDAARGVVPDRIIDRRKAGFGAPYRTWLRHDLRDLWDDVANENAVRRRGWFDPQALQRIRRQSDSGAADLYMLQWAVLTVELWARHFVDAVPAVVDKPARIAA